MEYNTNNWISVKDKLPDEEADVVFLIDYYVNGELYASLPCTGYFLEGKFFDDSDSEYDHTLWDGEVSNRIIQRVNYWFPQPKLPIRDC